MNINIIGWASPQIKKLCKTVITKTLQFMNVPDIEMTIKFVSPKEIKRLNKEFRQIDRVTDVLSFPATLTQVGDNLQNLASEYLGDMALCLKRAKQQAKEYGNTYCAEIEKLVVHSILHLLGYDHIQDEDYIIMQEKELQIQKFLHQGE